MIPSTPITNSALTTPLLSVADYGAMTGDTSTPTAVEKAITAAVTLAQRKLKRTIAYARYEENLYLYSQGMVFPSATPIDGTKSITAGGNIYTPSTPSSGGGQSPASVIQGAGIWVGWFTPLPWMPVFTGVIPPQTVIKYWGGYRPYLTTAGPTFGLPEEFASVLARIAYYVLHPQMFQPTGARSVSMGGISTSGGLSSMLRSDPQLRRDLLAWRRPQAHHWET